MIKMTFTLQINKDKNNIAFTAMTTVYGGTDGVKRFLKSQIMESVYRFEYSGHEIVSIELLSVYINRKSVTQYFKFRNVKMYGALFNYIGYMAHAVYKNGCCVPQFIVDTLHNPNEQKPRKRLAKLTITNVIDDLGMLQEDEGSCIEQVANFCKKER